MVGTLEVIGAVVIGLLAVGGTAYVVLGTDDVSGTETRLSDASLIVAMILFIGMLLWSLWTAS